MTTPRQRVTFILTQSLNCPSGVGRYWPLARGLAERGYRVRVLALHPDLDSLSRRRFIRDGVEVRYVGHMHVRKRNSRKDYLGTASLLWVAALATVKLTWAAVQSLGGIYHVGKPHPMNGIAALALLALGQRVYLDCDDLEQTSNRFGAGWQRTIVTWFENRLPRLVDGVSVNTRFLQGRISSLTDENQRIVLVPNAADPQRLESSNLDDVSEIRRENKLADHPVVVYVGSMNLANHPIDLLLDSFPKVLERVPEALLLLVGGGVDLPALRQRSADLGIAKSTRFIGRVSADDVFTYYSLAHVSVDPVRGDPTSEARSPLKIYESLAAGTPVVTGDTGDRRDIVGSHMEMLVKPGDPGALANGLTAFLQDEALRRRVRKWALSRRDQFCWTDRLDAFASLYEG